MERYEIVKHPHKNEYWALDTKTYRVVCYSKDVLVLIEKLREHVSREQKMKEEDLCVH